MRKTSKIILTLLCLGICFLSIGLFSACNQGPIKYTVTFDTDGGTEVQSVQVVSGEKVQKPTTEKDGCALVGWFNGVDEWNFNKDVVTKNITLKAKWTTQMFVVEDGVITGTNSLFKSVSVVDIPSEIDGETITKIGEYAFTNKNNIVSVNIPSTIKEIGSYAFESCKNLESVNIPIICDLEKIGDFAFVSCEKLQGFYIPLTVNSIGFMAFNGCDNLAEFTVHEYNLKYMVYEGNVYTKDGVSLLFFAPKKSEVKFLDDVQKIAPRAFSNCENITKIYFPSSIIEIGEFAFNQCHSLTNISFSETGSNLSWIRRYAFQDCGKIEGLENPPQLELVLPNKLITIEMGAFANFECITSVYIKQSTINIGANAFQRTPTSNTMVIKSQPKVKQAGWHDNWNVSNCQVIWGEGYVEAE